MSVYEKELALGVIFPHIHGDDVVGGTLEAQYTLSVDGGSTPADPGDGCLFQWQTSENREGPWTALPEGTERRLTLSSGEADLFIRVEVTPAKDGKQGRSIASDPVGPVMTTEDFTRISPRLTKEGPYLRDRAALEEEVCRRFGHTLYFTVDTELADGTVLHGADRCMKNGVSTDFGEARPVVRDGRVLVNAAFVEKLLGRSYDFRGASEAPLDEVLTACGMGAYHAQQEVEKAANGNWRTTAMAQGLVILFEGSAAPEIDPIADRDVLNELANKVYDLHAPKEDTEWFQDACFGMFIHWDPGTRTGMEIGWGRGTGPRRVTRKVPDYDLSYLDFDPEALDAQDIVQKAVDMGCKYLVFTSKHHAGFSFWDTKYFPEHSILGTPYGKDHRPEDADVVRKLADAAHEAGLRFGLYYSPQDWYNDYCFSDEHYRWLEMYTGQLTELLGRYGDIDVLWCDGIGSAVTMYENLAPEGYADDACLCAWDPRTLLRRVKQLQPHILVNDRFAYRWEDPKPWDEGALPEDIRGDFVTPEQMTWGFNDRFPWESCLTVDAGDAWSYNSDTEAKEPKALIRDIIVDRVNGGGVLLNMGLRQDGQFSPKHLHAFAEVGKWVKAHGEALYGVRGGPYREPSWGGSTCREKDRIVYLHAAPRVNGAEAIQGNSLHIERPENGWAFTKAALLDGREVELREEDGGYTLTLPAGTRFADGKTVDTLDTIIKLQ